MLSTDLITSHRLKTSFMLLFCSLVGSVLADSKPDGPPFVESRLPMGHLIVCGGGVPGEGVLERFVELAGAAEGKLVVIPSADGNPDDPERQAAWIAEWQERGVAEVSILHADSREDALKPEFSKPLESATAVWFTGGLQSRLAAMYVGTPVQKSLQRLLRDGRVIGGTSAGAAIMSHVMIASGLPDPVITTGLGLLPHVIIDQHFKQRRRLPRLRTAVRRHPAQTGIGIDEGTALEIRGRLVRVIGDGQIHAVIAEANDGGFVEKRMAAGDWLDLVSWRRAAVVRAAGGRDWSSLQPVNVENGSLVIVGGGGMPKPIVEEFMRLAGGKDARIVVLPTAVSDRDARNSGIPGFFRGYDVEQIDVLPQRNREEVESEEFLAKLENATAVWFGGGRQWRFVDAYAGTRAFDALHGVLQRGGVIGGSSAGASIQAEYLARGNPLGNTDMMALGYQEGFGFLPGTAIDQHFGQRRRFADLAAVMDRFPRLIGLGIDEATALVVSGQQGRVIGRGTVHCYVGSQRSVGDIRGTFELTAGDAYRFDVNRPIPGPPPLPESR